MKKFTLITMIVAAFAAVPASAIAADGYTDVAGVTQDESSGPTSTASTPSSVEAVTSAGDTSGSLLPFTGLQLALMFGAGVALIGTGLLLRRTHTR